MSEIMLCQAKQGQLTTKRIPVTPDQTICEVLEAAANFASAPASKIVLTYQGHNLKPNTMLKQYKVKPGGLLMVTVLPPDPEHVDKPKPVKMSGEEVKRFTIAFGSAFKHPAFSKVVKRLLQRENMESLAAACPGLETDLVAQGFLTRPELLLHLLDPNTLAKVAAEHPCILEAAHNLAAAVHEEQATGTVRQGEQEQPSSTGTGGGSYYLDEMSDDEMEGDEQGQGTSRGAARNRASNSFSAITPAQLEQALSIAASAAGGSGGVRGGFQGVTGLGPAVPSPTTASVNSPSSRITSDMFQAAMMQALTGMSGGGQQQTQAVEPDYSEQVARMKEMGIIDEGLAIRALQLNGGDLQAAVNLILSGWEGDEAMS